MKLFPLVMLVLVGAACGSGSAVGTDAGGRDDAGHADAGDAPTDAGSQLDAGGGPPSCLGLSASCGPSGSDDCCRSSLVPGGSFNRANNDAAPAAVTTFTLDTYEVTVGRFRRFVEAGGGTQALLPAAGLGAHPAIPDSGWQSSWDGELEPDTASLMARLRSGPGATWTDTPGANEAQPINHVVWLEAFAFCAWDGGRLPTEAERSFAAVGGSEQRGFPWSVPPSSSVIDATFAAYACLGDGLSGCSALDLRPVGSYSPVGDGRWGHADLAGNVAEWLLDEWHPEWLLPCVDCARLQPALYTFRAVGGGAYPDDSSALSGRARRDLSAFYRWDRQGFRCARNP